MSDSVQRARSEVIHIRLSPEEKRHIDAMAERANLSIGSYMRRLAVDAPVPRQGRRPPVEKRLIGMLMSHLGHVGGNLNQITKRLNTGLPIDGVELSAALKVILELRDLGLKSLGYKI